MLTVKNTEKNSNVSTMSLAMPTSLTAREVCLTGQREGWGKGIWALIYIFTVGTLVASPQDDLQGSTHCSIHGWSM